MYTIVYTYITIIYDSSHLANVVKHFGALFATPSQICQNIMQETGSGFSTYSFIPCSQHRHNVNRGSIPDAKIHHRISFFSARIRCLYCPLIDADQHYVRYHSPTLCIRIHRISQEKGLGQATVISI